MPAHPSGSTPGHDLVGSAVPVPVAHDSVEMARLLLGAAAAGGADARRLAADARLPGWALAQDRAMIPSRYSMRLWELTEYALEDPQVALTVAARHQAGDLDLYDYLFTTSATLRDALAASSRHLHLVTTAGRLRLEADTGAGATYSYRYTEPGGRGADLRLQFAVAALCARATAAAGRAVIPAQVTLAQLPPRCHRALTDALGTTRIDFGAPATTLTFRARDLDLPLPGADPVLARILARYAATLPRRRRPPGTSTSGTCSPTPSSTATPPSPRSPAAWRSAPAPCSAASPITPPPGAPN